MAVQQNCRSDLLDDHFMPHFIFSSLLLVNISKFLDAPGHFVMESVRDLGRIQLV